MWHRAQCFSNQQIIKVVNGQRTLLKENVPVRSVHLSECLRNFTTFLFNDKTDCYTILVGHNSSVFDTPTLLRCARPVVKELLSSKNVFFADSLYLVRALIKAGNPSLNPKGKLARQMFLLFFKLYSMSNLRHMMLWKMFLHFVAYSFNPLWS